MKKGTFYFFNVLSWAAAICLVPLVSVAQEPQPPQILDVRVGFGGRYKVGGWTPVEVTLLGGDIPLTARVELTVADGDGVKSRVTSPRPSQLLPGGRTKAVLYARFGQVDSGL